jgi:hypothetical protein
LKNKTGFAAALISNCNTPSKRDEYILQLQEAGVAVHVYGKCGNMSLPIKKKREYYKELSRRYKFFLSFENSFCRDYATEKLFGALSFPWIPVVRGGANYSLFAPESSVIDASSYSPVQLARVLHEVAGNDTLYQSYFEWKKVYEVSMGMKVPWICKACQMLQTKTEPKTYGDIYEWWVTKSHCRVPEVKLRSKNGTA